MRFCLLLIISFFGWMSSVDAQEEFPVFISGQENYTSYRIPAIISMPDGRLLAFAEGRVHHTGDFGDVNIVLKISRDRGKTWDNLRTIVDYDELHAGNPAPVIDMADPNYPNGRIFLFYNTGNNTEYDIRKGNGYREVWYITSEDGGETWTQAVNITTQVHRPQQPEVNPDYDFQENWRAYANTPGHALQFSWGKYRGRIYVPAYHSSGDLQFDARDYHAHGYYTDDHGKTFQVSQPISLGGGNEATAAQFSEEGLMMNVRNQNGSVKARFIALSNDGGETWYREYFDRNLPDPVCEGSLLNVNRRVIAFCNNADTSGRNNLTLRLSTNRGESWFQKTLIYSNDKVNDASGYSDIVNVNDRTIGVLYEKDNYSSIVFTTVEWSIPVYKAPTKKKSHVVKKSNRKRR